MKELEGSFVTSGHIGAFNMLIYIATIFEEGIYDVEFPKFIWPGEFLLQQLLDSTAIISVLKIVGHIMVYNFLMAWNQSINSSRPFM